jgi:hypothetical protein
LLALEHQAGEAFSASSASFTVADVADEGTAVLNLISIFALVEFLQLAPASSLHAF